jgi:hypothetical protein
MTNKKNSSKSLLQKLKKIARKLKFRKPFFESYEEGYNHGMERMMLETSEILTS